MIVVVTGATGNIGSAVVKRLLRDGHDVRGVARRAPRDGPMGAHIQWTELDLTAPDRGLRLRHVFAGADVVVHTAWGFQPTRNTAYLQRLDVGGTAAVLRAASAALVPHLIHVSSVGAYSPGVDSNPVTEDWPTGGAAPLLPYSRHKAAAERMLDGHEAVPGNRPRVARIRPSLVARVQVGAALGRYVLPSLLPAAALRLVPVIPLDRRFRVQLTHSDDIAAGIAAVVRAGATGPFNLSAEPVLTREDVSRVWGRPPIHLPWPALRTLAAAAWAARLQPVDPGWLDLTRAVPVMSSERARRELDWAPAHDSREVLIEALSGLFDQVGAPTPALRPRRWSEQARNLVSHGPVSRMPIS